MTVERLLAASRRKQLARIHILKKNLGMQDGDYRDFLEATTGQRSATNLSIQQRGEVIEHLERKERGARKGANSLRVPTHSRHRKTTPES